MESWPDQAAGSVSVPRSGKSAEYRLPPPDSPGRSFAKAITWKPIALLITAMVAYALTGSLRFAASVGVVDSVVKLLAYYAHERAWVNFARARQPLKAGS